MDHNFMYTKYVCHQKLFFSYIAEWNLCGYVWHLWNHLRTEGTPQSVTYWLILLNVTYLVIAQNAPWIATLCILNMCVIRNCFSHKLLNRLCVDEFGTYQLTSEQKLHHNQWNIPMLLKNINFVAIVTYAPWLTTLCVWNMRVISEIFPHSVLNEICVDVFGTC